MPHRYTLHTAAQLHGFRRTRAIIRLDLYTPHLYRRVVSNYTNNRSVLNEYCPYQISKVISRVLSRPRLSIPPRSRLTLTLETTGVKLLTMGFLRSSGDHVSPTGAGVRSIEDDRYVSRSRDIILRNVGSTLPCLIEISNTSKIHGFASRRLLNNLSSNRKAFPAHDRSIGRSSREKREGIGSIVSNVRVSTYVRRWMWHVEDKRHASSQVTTSGIYLKPHYLGATFALWYCFFVPLLTRLPLVGKGPRFFLSLSLHGDT